MVEKFKLSQILLGDKNATSLCSKNISTLKAQVLLNKMSCENTDV